MKGQTAGKVREDQKSDGKSLPEKKRLLAFSPLEG